MGLGALLLVERQRQRQENAERERAALREAEKRPRLPDGFDRDSARRAIIAEFGRHFRGQLFAALQNGLPSLSDGALYELYCEATDRGERAEPEREPEPEPEPQGDKPEPQGDKPEPQGDKPEPQPEEPAQLEPKPDEPKPAEAPAEEPKPKPEGKKDGRRGR